MALNEWLAQFRGQHEQAKKGALTGPELKRYHDARDELATALLAAQQVALAPGQQPRRTLRAARALQADVAFFDGTLRVATLSISAGGFAAILARPPKIHEEVKVALRLPGGEPMQASAAVVEVKVHAGSALVSFKWIGLQAIDVERLETTVFDAVLDKLCA